MAILFGLSISIPFLDRLDIGSCLFLVLVCALRAANIAIYAAGKSRIDAVFLRNILLF